MRPYLHIDIPFKIKTEWKNSVNKFDISKHILDHGCSLLENETRDFLSGTGINLNIADYWSWKYLTESIYNFYHIDYDIDKPNDENHAQVALNFLLEGDPGETQWTDLDKCLKINSMVNYNPIFGTIQTNFISKEEPIHITSLIPKKVMLNRIDIPHRVCRDKQINTRWTYRIILKIGDHYVTWDEAKSMFSKYSI
jgi:hypothetical protein